MVAVSARISRTVVVAALLVTATACDMNAVPPTVTPPPQGAELPGQQPGTSVEIPVEPPGGMPISPEDIPPLEIEQLVLYRDPEGRFSLEVPSSWPAQPQDVGGDPTSDVRLGMLFPSPDANGLVTVTQFDNGQPPQNIGNLSSQILQLTGVTQQRGFRELGRTNVLEREGQAIRVSLEYTRRDGLPMRGLVQFQADNTTFSMVNVSVAKASWLDNEPEVHAILGSYSVPAAPAAPLP